VPDVNTSDADGDQPAPRRPHAILRYTTLRLALFVLALIVLWLVRIRDGVLLVAIALVLSGLASFVLLASQRDAMSAQLHEAARRRRVKARSRAAREDVPDEADV
jgi:ABC-type protease/lipase transport system fused ATPase/permease subunit